MKMQNHNIIKKWIGSFFVMFLCFFGTMDIEAATKKATVTVEDAMVEEGDMVKVTVKLSSSVEIGTYFYHIKYDESILEYQSGAYAGGNGVLTLMGNGAAKEYTHILSFKGLKEGVSKIDVSLETGDAICPLKVKYGEVMKVSETDGEVLVSATVNQSEDTTLGTLDIVGVKSDGTTTAVTLSPEFNPEVYQYRINVAGDVEKYEIVALPTDFRAQVSAVKGTKLSVGENLTKITVTAENGATKSYMIYTTKAKIAASNTKTEQGTDDSTAQVLTGERVKIKIGKTTYYTVTSMEGRNLQEGLEVAQYAYKGKNILIAQGVTKDIKIVYLTDKKGENGKYFVYDVNKDSFYPYQYMTENGNIYSVMEADEGVTIPAGYEKGTGAWYTQNINGWVLPGQEDFYLVYAMNGKGEKNLYRVDAIQHTIQRYDAYDDSNINASASKAQLDSLEKKIKQLEKEKKQESNQKGAMIVALMLCVIILIFMWLRMRIKWKSVTRKIEKIKKTSRKIINGNVNRKTVSNNKMNKGKAIIQNATLTSNTTVPNHVNQRQNPQTAGTKNNPNVSNKTNARNKANTQNISKAKGTKKFRKK